MKNKLVEKIIAFTIAVPFVLFVVILFLIYNIFAYGFVSMKLYNWFVIPYFPNLPSLDLLVFSGFTLFFYSVLPKTRIPKLKEEYYEENYNLKMLGDMILKPWLLLFISFLLKIYIF